MKLFSRLLLILTIFGSVASADTLYDKSRDRQIPVEITYPVSHGACTKAAKCAVAFLSAGYGVPYTEYTFIVRQLNQQGFLVVAIGHELPGDPPLSVIGDLYQTRSENWMRGAETLEFIQQELSKRFTHYDFDRVLLIGHSNDGDISSWLGNEGRLYIQGIITLDHRRVPLPRSSAIKVLSIRTSDFPADKGVLPSSEEQNKYGSCVVKIQGAKHRAMSDYGPPWLQKKIVKLINNHLNGQSCRSLQKLSSL